MPSLERKSKNERIDIISSITEKASLSTVSVTQIAKGHDSHVFECVLEDGSRRALKIYDYEYLGRNERQTGFQLNR